MVRPMDYILEYLNRKVPEVCLPRPPWQVRPQASTVGAGPQCSSGLGGGLAGTSPLGQGSMPSPPGFAYGPSSGMPSSSVWTLPNGKPESSKRNELFHQPRWVEWCFRVWSWFGQRIHGSAQCQLGYSIKSTSSGNRLRGIGPGTYDDFIDFSAYGSCGGRRSGGQRFDSGLDR